jgi:ATP-binding cassette, subfamily B, bacterial
MEPLRWLKNVALWAINSLRWRRVPVMLQMNSVECGAACLAMMLNYYGRKTTISECREICQPGRDGLSALMIARAARHFGLRVKAYSTEPENFKYLPLPAIVHWQFQHFLIVEQWAPEKIEVVDPSGGRRALSGQEFNDGFTGVVLTMEPGTQFERRRRPVKHSWRSYIHYVLTMPGLYVMLAQVLGASLLVQLLGLVFPLFTKILIDDILPHRMTGILTMVGLGLGVIILSQAVIAYLRSILLIYLQARLDTRLMLGFFEHTLSLPFRFFQQRNSGDLLMRLSSNATIREVLTSQSISVILDGAFVIGYLAILLHQEITYGIIVLVLGFIQIAVLLGTTRKIHRLNEMDLAAQAESQSYLVEALTGLATLKANGAEVRALEHWSDLFFKQLNVSIKRSHLSAVISAGLGTLRAFSPVILLWVGAHFVLNGSMSLGMMLALNALATSFLSPLASLVSTGQQLQTVAAHLDRITDVIEAAPEQNPESVQFAPTLKGGIVVKGVSFHYDAEAPPVLQNISFTVRPGQKVALVGPTGSGKSTLALLLLGFYTPTAGHILYDGIPLHDLEYRSLRSQFGVVLQEPFLFSGSIRQNIAFHNPGLSLEEIVEATKVAAIDAEIAQMPMGLETVLAEGGIGLSGGQRQRLAIARAIVHQPKILLLDEATSHLDTRTEQQVECNLNGLACTRVVIAHRLSTICDADHILVLDRGRIVEQGTHGELLAAKGYYASFVNGDLQLQEADPSAVTLKRRRHVPN